ncbi:hypothetical protein GCM10023351_29360 [Microbacterium gilvum]|uniref:histidine kinase n=1 Tax=Microbacterium gilvum TaxID=1336204 RepID=A0ABP9ALX0_9MICO
MTVARRPDALTRWWRRVSLRAKVTGVTVFVLASGLLTTGIVTVPILHSNLVQNVETTVLQYAESGSSVTDRLFEPIWRAADGELMVRAVEPAVVTEFFVAIYDRDGQLLAVAGGDGDDEPPVFPEELPLDKAFTATNHAQVLESADGHGFRGAVSVESVTTDRGEIPYSQVVALPLSTVDGFLRTYIAVFTITSIATVLIAAFLTRGLVTLTFRRFGQVEATAMEIAAGDFSQRMTDIEPRTEIGRLKIAINTMLDRIDGAIDERDATVQQMRRFVGDASHELRTPLVSVRGYAELYRMGALQDEEATAKAMERIEAEAKRMGVLVEDLLALTRLDDRREALHIRPVDLRPIAHDAALDVRAAEPGREVAVLDHTYEALTAPIELPLDADPTPSRSTEESPPAAQRRRRAPSGSAIARASAATRSVLRRRRPEQPGDADEVEQLDIPVLAPSKPVALPPVVLGEEDKIRQVVANLLGNARRYSAHDAPIRIEVGVDSERGRGWIAIVDHGEGVPESIRDKVFQRFWRADTSRARETGGSGLGLAIVASIVESLRGSVDVTDTPGGGATFRVSLPLADAYPVHPAGRAQGAAPGASDDPAVDA